MIKDTKKIKIGILNESSHIPVSQSVKRAMLIAEKALGDIGYQIVRFNIDDEFWTKGREFFMGMAANGTTPPMVDDFKRECETMLKPLERTLIILNSNPVKRFFIDFALRYILNNGR